jgi:hypothetical protein
LSPLGGYPGNDLRELQKNVEPELTQPTITKAHRFIGYVVGFVLADGLPT